MYRPSPTRFPGNWDPAITANADRQFHDQFNAECRRTFLVNDVGTRLAA